MRGCLPAIAMPSRVAGPPAHPAPLSSHVWLSNSGGAGAAEAGGSPGRSKASGTRAVPPPAPLHAVRQPQPPGAPPPLPKPASSGADTCHALRLDQQPPQQQPQLQAAPFHSQAHHAPSGWGAPSPLVDAGAHGGAPRAGCWPGEPWGYPPHWPHAQRGPPYHHPHQQQPGAPPYWQAAPHPWQQPYPLGPPHAFHAGPWGPHTLWLAQQAYMGPGPLTAPPPPWFGGGGDPGAAAPHSAPQQLLRGPGSPLVPSLLQQRPSSMRGRGAAGGLPCWAASGALAMPAAGQLSALAPAGPMLEAAAERGLKGWHGPQPHQGQAAHQQSMAEALPEEQPDTLPETSPPQPQPPQQQHHQHQQQPSQQQRPVPADVWPARGVPRARDAAGASSTALAHGGARGAHGSAAGPSGSGFIRVAAEKLGLLLS
jgi:hypothetical protein